jgi:Ca2+-binding EF-hand superfamily protein
MRVAPVLLMGTAALFLGLAECLAQPPGENGFGGGRGGRGFSSGYDPNESFNRLSNGKDVWSRADISDPSQQRYFDSMAERLGVSNSQITREQYLNYQQERSLRRRGGDSPPPTGDKSASTPVPITVSSPAPVVKPVVNSINYDRFAELQFQRYDKNGDGYLSYDEMPEPLRLERDKWDVNKDGLIDLAEYKAYYQALMEQRREERNAATQMWSASHSHTSAAGDEEQKPVVYRAGKLPKELPPWFAQLDTDHDGQIGLYEWKNSGRSIEEFQQIDRNGDGFLTVEEVLRYERLRKAGSSTSVADRGSSVLTPRVASRAGNRTDSQPMPAGKSPWSVSNEGGKPTLLLNQKMGVDRKTVQEKMEEFKNRQVRPR